MSELYSTIHAGWFRTLSFNDKKLSFYIFNSKCTVLTEGFLLMLFIRCQKGLKSNKIPKDLCALDTEAFLSQDELETQIGWHWHVLAKQVHVN
jgi:hypothetical protein